MTRRARTDIVIIFTALIVAGTLGYLEGKHAADRWYARNIPCSTHCLTYPVQNEGVTLIPPIKVRTAAPVASLEKPKSHPRTKQKECQDSTSGGYTDGYQQYKCSGGKWVVDDEAMKSLAEMESHKRDLQWELQTCVLDEKSMREVQSYGSALFSPAPMQTYFQADIERSHADALSLQNQLRAEHAVSCKFNNDARP